ASFVGTTVLGEDVSAQSERLAVPSSEFRRIGDGLEREIGLTDVLVDLRDLEVSDPELGIGDDGLASELDGAGVVPGVISNERGERVVHSVERIEFAGASHGAHGFLVAPEMRELDAEHAVSDGEVAVEFDGAAEGCLGERPVPVQEQVEEAERDLRLGEVRGRTNRLSGRLTG